MAPRRHKETEGLPTYDSFEQCASATGIPVSVIKQAKAKDARYNGCPAFNSNRVYLRPLLGWYFNEFTPDLLLDWGNRDKKAAAEIKEEKLKQIRKESIKFSDIQTIHPQLMHTLFDMLHTEFAAELPPTIVGRQEREVSELCRKKIERIRTRLTEMLRDWEATLEDEERREAEQERISEQIVTELKSNE